ncbi:hypothetical protein F0919_13175 [Taibaiella lutea]|uniref:Lipoprotein n=1 Tax=Taibaiella lutea TaxID=2608001 RepID=A0A5M6CEK9_9BACT|nr:hypothetical protein [Taibaiella lutea]KAA5533487.1 hypothetical protein F0919_13175 [Taibaiella lutea]
MKSVILLGTALIGFIAISSCQKDKAVNAPNTSTAINRTANTTKMKPILIFGPDRYRIYVQADASCVYTGGNCLDDIVIVAPKVKQLMNTIMDGGDYSAFIRTNMEDLSADIPGDYLQGVVDSKYTLAIDNNQSTGMQYLKFMDSKDFVLVIPIKK